MKTRDLARALDLSEGRVSQLLKQGMPSQSVEAAQVWRSENTNKRVATTGPNAGRVILMPGVEPRKKNGKEIFSFESSGDPQYDILLSARFVQAKARDMLMDAMNSETYAAIPSLISNHNKATEAAMEAGISFREDLERRGLLVTKQAFIDDMRRIMEPILRRLRKFPGEVGPKLALKDGIQTSAILDRETSAVIKLVEEALSVLKS